MYYGKDKMLPNQIELHAGPLTLLYEQGDLRNIFSGNTEILCKIYVAIRDRDWNTIAPVFSNMKMDITNDSFMITFDAINQQNDIDFAWKGIIRGETDGTISYTMDGEARSTFWRNRIGFCVLHPASLSGSSCQIQHLDGRTERADFPLDFALSQPVAPFLEMKKISHLIRSGVKAEVEFSGDIFEMEDQRNWTDASYKTYSTPLSLIFPTEIKAGTKVSQSILLRVTQDKIKPGLQAVESNSPSPDGLRIEVNRTASEMLLPKLGLGSASHGLPLSSGEIERLRRMHLHHLRVDLRLADDVFVNILEAVTQQAIELDLKMEVALLISDQIKKELAKLRAILHVIRPPVCSWLCYVDKEWMANSISVSDVLPTARKYLADYNPSIPICSGTNSDFIFLRKSLPALDQIQKICFAINPQSHAFDNASLIETLKVQGAAVISARHLSKGLPVLVSPITFKPRFNPYATGSVSTIHTSALPPQVDARQMSLFGAGWTLGSFKYIAEAGADSVTYFETSGWQGVMEIGQGCARPEGFYSFPGCVFPLYHVLTDIGEFTGGSLLPVRTSYPPLVNGLLLRNGEQERMLLANHSSQPQRVRLYNLLPTRTIRRLDETNMVQAMQSPLEYRQAAELPFEVNAGSLEMEMMPFSVIKIDSK
jgi:hypothetical protein